MLFIPVFRAGGSVPSRPMLPPFGLPRLAGTLALPELTKSGYQAEMCSQVGCLLICEFLMVGVEIRCLGRPFRALDLGLDCKPMALPWASVECPVGARDLSKER